MKEVKWIKIVTDIFDNRKIKQIESLPECDTILVVWIKLLCLAGDINDYGQVYLTKEIPYTDQMLANQFNRPIATVQLALNVFEQFEMIEIVDDIYRISNWEKYQNVEGMEKIREQAKVRVAKYRERKRIGEKVCNVTSNVTVTHSNALDIDKEKDIDIEKTNSELHQLENWYKDNEKKVSAKRFKAPTLEEVREYCKARNSNVNPDKFYEYYSTGDWKDAKGNKVQNWKQKIITWESKNNATNNKKVYAAEDMKPAELDLDKLNKELFGNGKQTK